MEPKKKVHQDPNSATQIQSRFTKLITLIGDLGIEQLQEHINKLSTEIVNAQAQHVDFIQQKLAQWQYLFSVSWIPGKHTIYAAVVAQVSQQQENFLQNLLGLILELLQEVFQQGNYIRVVMILSFIGELVDQGNISNQDFINLLTKMLEFDQLDALQSHFIAYTMINALQNIGRVLDSYLSQNFWSKLANFLENLPNLNPKLIELTIGIRPNWIISQRTNFLADQLKINQKQNFPIQIFPTFMQQDQSAISLPQIDLQLPINSSYWNPYLTQLINLDISAQELAIYSEYIRLTIIAFKDSTERAADRLNTIQTNFQLEALIVNVIMDEILSLPVSSCNHTIYYSILIQLKEMNSVELDYHNAVNSAIYTLYSTIESVDLQACENIENFLVFYVTNTDYIWNWEMFYNDTPSNHQIRFIRNFLNKLIRFAFIGIIQEKIPENLHHYMITQITPYLKFAEMEESVDNTDCQLILDRINSKATEQAMRQLLVSKEICNSGQDLDKIFCQCVFYQGGKSLLHFTTYLDRYNGIVKQVKQEILLDSLYEVWQNYPYQCVILVKKLLDLEYVRCTDIVNFGIRLIEQQRKQFEDWFQLEWDLIYQGTRYASDEEALQISQTLQQFVANSDDPIQAQRFLSLQRKNYAKFLNFFEWI